MSRHPKHSYPQTIQQFRNLPGPYGALDVIARGQAEVELNLTQEFVRLNRDDAQEMIRVLSAWLAGPVVDTQEVRTHGANSHVIVVDDGPGAPHVSVRDNDANRAEPASHFRARTRCRGGFRRALCDAAGAS